MASSPGVLQGKLTLELCSCTCKLITSDGLLLTIQHTVLLNQNHDEKQNTSSIINRKCCLQDGKCNEVCDFQIIKQQNKRILKKITTKYFKLKGV